MASAGFLAEIQKGKKLKKVDSTEKHDRSEASGGGIVGATGNTAGGRSQPTNINRSPPASVPPPGGGGGLLAELQRRQQQRNIGSAGTVQESSSVPKSPPAISSYSSKPAPPAIPSYSSKPATSSVSQPPPAPVDWREELKRRNQTKSSPAPPPLPSTPPNTYTPPPPPPPSPAPSTSSSNSLPSYQGTPPPLPSAPPKLIGSRPPPPTRVPERKTQPPPPPPLSVQSQLAKPPPTPVAAGDWRAELAQRTQTNTPPPPPPPSYGLPQSYSGPVSAPPPPLPHSIPQNSNSPPGSGDWRAELAQKTQGRGTLTPPPPPPPSSAFVQSQNLTTVQSTQSGAAPPPPPPPPPRFVDRNTARSAPQPPALSTIKVQHLSNAGARGIIEYLSKCGASSNDKLFREQVEDVDAKYLLQEAMHCSDGDGLCTVLNLHQHAVIAHSLKLYFKDLPTCIIPPSLHGSMIDAVQGMEPDEASRRIASYLSSIQQEHFLLLKELCEFLAQIEGPKSMLAYTWGPLLIRLSISGAGAADPAVFTRVKNANTVVQILIERHTIIFASQPTGGPVGGISGPPPPPPRMLGDQSYAGQNVAFDYQSKPPPPPRDQGYRTQQPPPPPPPPPPRQGYANGW